MGALITWLILGLIAGYIIHYIDRKERQDITPTLVIGIIGAVLGGILANMLSGFPIATLDLTSILFAVAGGLVLTWVGRIVMRTEESGTQRMVGSAGGMAYTPSKEETFKKSTQPRRLVNPIHLQIYLKNVNFPATKQELIDAADKEDADDDVLYTLNQLPDRTYYNRAGISEELNKKE